MLKLIKLLKRKIGELGRFEVKKIEYLERLMVNQGRLLVSAQQSNESTLPQDYEFSIFSQFGEDGIIQFLVRTIEIKHKTFIEFGVEDFTESNCRFLLLKDNWKGFVLDGSPSNVSKIRNSYYYWKHDLTAISEFITKDNIDELLGRSRFDGDLGIMSIDLDGIDYFILSSISQYRPRILICEYNSLFGATRKITVPYESSFKRFNKHSSGLYWGASLSAISKSADDAGYELVATNSAGCNAFFVRKDCMRHPLQKVNPESVFTIPTYSDSRDSKGNLTFLSFSERQSLIAGLPVINIESDKIEYL